MLVDGELVDLELVPLVPLVPLWVPLWRVWYWLLLMPRRPLRLMLSLKLRLFWLLVRLLHIFFVSVHNILHVSEGVLIE